MMLLSRLFVLCSATSTSRTALTPPGERPRRGIFVAVPSWHAEVAPSQFAPNPWAVPHYLLRHLERSNSTARTPDEASVIYVGVYVHGDLSPSAQVQNKAWLAGGTSVLPLSDGTMLDLEPHLQAGRVFITAFGPRQCDLVRSPALEGRVRLVYFDAGFDRCRRASRGGLHGGVMAPTYSPVVTLEGGASCADGACERENPRPNLLFFWGHIPKPYVDPPLSSVRYRVYRALREAAEPGVVVGATDVSATVNPYTARTRDEHCAVCSYSCKRCYYEPAFEPLSNDRELSLRQFASHMRSATFCVAARGDDPLTPKLAESVLAGCIPVAVVDSPLPFHDVVDYAAFALKLDPAAVLADPPSLLRTIKALSPARREAMHAALHRERRKFEYDRADGLGAEAEIAAQMLRLVHAASKDPEPW